MRAYSWIAAVAVVAGGCAAPPSGDALSGSDLTDSACDILVVGGGLGAVAAAHEAASQGKRVCLAAEADWLGGQLTTQGVPLDAVDPYVYSRTLEELLDRIIERYRRDYPGAPRSGWFNPGACGRPVCWEPRVAAEVLEQELLQPLERAGVLQIWKRVRPIAVARSGNTITGVTFSRPDGSHVALSARVTIDATELGDLMPLGQVPHRAGRDPFDAFQEPHAIHDAGDAQCLQRFTFPIAVERRPTNEDHRIARPPHYDASKYGAVGAVFDIDARINPVTTWWSWRRYLAPDNLGGPSAGIPDITSINYFGANDFATEEAWCGPNGCNVVDRPDAVRDAILEYARDHALGFFYYLQNDVRRPGDTQNGGYKYLKLRPDVMGSSDGLSQFPYVREARRLEALTTIVEQNLPAAPGNLGDKFDDTVGTAEYGVDIKGCPRGDINIDWGPARSVTIPLGALIPMTVDGFLAGGKDLGVSHIANGVYRIHQNEWNVGQAAGAAAALSVELGVQPRALRADVRALRLLQERLLSGRSGPLVWLSDVARPSWQVAGDRGFVAIQMAAVAGIMNGYTVHVTPPPPAGPYDVAEFHPEAPLTRAQAAIVAGRELGFTAQNDCAQRMFEDVACDHFAFGEIQALALRAVVSGYACGSAGEPCVEPARRPYFRPGNPVTRAQFAKIVALGDCLRAPGLCYSPSLPPPGYSDVSPSDWFYDFVAADRAHGTFAGADAGRAGVFGPGDTMTRRETAIWLYNHFRSRLGL